MNRQMMSALLAAATLSAMTAVASDKKPAAGSNSQNMVCQNNSCHGQNDCKGFGSSCAGKASCAGHGIKKATDQKDCETKGGKWVAKAK